jgi:hypothetical protein
VSHALEAPLALSPAELAAMPPPCVSDADGFLLTGAPSPEPNLRFSPANELVTRRVEAQFVWSARGVCTRALAADTEGPQRRVSGNAVPASLPRVPLTVTERRPQGRRSGYVCAP